VSVTLNLAKLSWWNSGFFFTINLVFYLKLNRTMETGNPLLFSFRRCPYAMRARMAIHASGIVVNLCEVELKRKPEHMLALSPKGTVPVLQCGQRVLEESLDIVLWALQQHDPEHWLECDQEQAPVLLKQADESFKYWLDRYKYYVGYPEQPPEVYRERAHTILQEWNQRLNESGGFLLGELASYVDVALFPFVRQFANVDPAWFAQADGLDALRGWLDGWIQSARFREIMHKGNAWVESRGGCLISL